MNYREPLSVGERITDDTMIMRHLRELDAAIRRFDRLPNGVYLDQVKQALTAVERVGHNWATRQGAAMIRQAKQGE